MQIAMDVAIISLPIWPLSKLVLSKMNKAMLLFMFGTGFMYALRPYQHDIANEGRITIVSCLRLQALVTFAKSPDITSTSHAFNSLPPVTRPC
jgi:hypothetical protein